MRRNIVAGATYGRVATGSDFAFAAARRFGDAMNSYLDNDLMRRRRLLVLSAGAAISGSPVLLSAQTPATSLRRVAVLAPSTRAKEEVTLKPFFDQMRALGWIEGQTIAYDRAFADDRHEDLPRLATELVARKPELVYAPPSIAARAAWQATRTIPMVFATANDPVREGFVASLGRPGGNATGLSNISASLLPKRIQLLREILPGVKRIGRLLDPADSSGRQAQQEFAPVAASLGLTITMAEPADPAGFDAAVAELFAARVDAIYAASVLALNMRGRLIELANQKRVPVIGVNPGKIITQHLRRTLPAENGVIVADISQDCIKVAVIERHGLNGNIGVGFVNGFGLKHGAIASTVGHDSHNICVVGVSDDNMAVAANRMKNIGGGFVVVRDSQVLAELPLPIAGLMSDKSFEDVRVALIPLRAAAKSLGTVLQEPFLQVAFLPLPVIPHLKITDRGMVDVDRFVLL